MTVTALHGENYSISGLPMALGTLGFGSFVAADEANKVLDAFWERGGRIVDLAPSYGHGLARQIVANYIRQRGRALLIWDKIGLAYAAESNLRGAITLSYEEPHTSYDLINNLSHMYGAPISCLQLHAPIPVIHRQRILELVAKAQDSQIVESIGIANHNALETIELVESAADFDITIRQSQVHLNLLEQRATVELLPINNMLAIETWANRVLARGALLNLDEETKRHQESIRLSEYKSNYSYDIASIEDLIYSQNPDNYLQTLVTWPLSQISVHGVIVGASTVHQLEQLVDCIQMPSDSATLDKLTNNIRKATSLEVTQRPRKLFDESY